MIGHASSSLPAHTRDLAERVEGLLAGGALRLGKLLDLLGPELGEEAALGAICRLFLRDRLHLGLRGVPLSDRTPEICLLGSGNFLRGRATQGQPTTD